MELSLSGIFFASSCRSAVGREFGYIGLVSRRGHEKLLSALGEPFGDILVVNPYVSLDFDVLRMPNVEKT